MSDVSRSGRPSPVGHRRRFILWFVIGSMVGVAVTAGAFALFDSIGHEYNQQPFQHLRRADDLGTWAALDKPVRVGYRDEHDIYHGLIFPLFESDDVEEILFSSTSLLWGHFSIGGTKIIDEACSILERSSSASPKRIAIISATPNIDKLLDEYGPRLTNAMRRFSKALETANPLSRAVVGTFHVTSYWMLVRLTGAKRAYEVYFLNAPQQSHIVPFDGRIHVTALSPDAYERRRGVFEEHLSAAVPFETEIPRLEAKLPPQ